MTSNAHFPTWSWRTHHLGKNLGCYLLALWSSEEEMCSGWKPVVHAPWNDGASFQGDLHQEDLLQGHCFSKKLLPLDFRRRSQLQDFHDAAEPREPFPRELWDCPPPSSGHGALTAQSLTIAEGQAGGSLLPVTLNTG